MQMQPGSGCSDAECPTQQQSPVRAASLLMGARRRQTQRTVSFHRLRIVSVAVRGAHSDARWSRDREYLGIHAHTRAEIDSSHGDWKFHLDPYGTLHDKTATIAPEKAVRSIQHARETILPLAAALTESADVRARVHAAAINPILWTLGHVGYFYEAMLLDVFGVPKTAVNALVRSTEGLFGGMRREQLFDSIIVNRADRVASELWQDPRTSHVHAYVAAVLEDVVAYLASPAALCGEQQGQLHPVDTFVVTYAVIHEWWHIEDLRLTAQMMGLALPNAALMTEDTSSHCQWPSDYTLLTDANDCMWSTAAASPQPPVSNTRTLAESYWVAVPGGTHKLGCISPADGGGSSFVFDQEKWAHEIHLEPFDISRTPVTNRDFAAFVDAGGYTSNEHWSFEGWRWRLEGDVKKPMYWSSPPGSASDLTQKSERCWCIRRFGKDVPLKELACHPVEHLSWWEAEAYCVWAGVRLPTEAEWEVAAGASESRYPWGDEFFCLDHESSAARGAPPANVEGVGTVDVEHFARGDSSLGCRQMIGNVWEWTSSTFYPFPGYALDWPYRENSAPWFGFSKVCKGGSWSTSALLCHSRHRNFYGMGDRREVAVGFRVVRLHSC
eukprot:SAG31_NODE_3805_length_3866_cov_2.814972_2_plen_612_part_00